MVKQPADRCFLSEESGATIAEGLIALPLVMLVFAAFIEFGYAMFQWNQTVKAVHYGARLAAVSTSVFDVADFDVVAAAAAPTSRMPEIRYRSRTTDPGLAGATAGPRATASSTVSSMAVPRRQIVNRSGPREPGRQCVI